MGELRLTLLGRPHVSCDDIPLAGWSLQKSLALLAYLAVTSRPQSREALAGLLWPTCSEANARSNLRKVLSELRRWVPSHLTITRGDVAFDWASDYWLDVEAFEGRISQALGLRQSPVTRTGAGILSEAIELYRDGFLVGVTVQRAAAFEEWVLLEGEHLRNLALRALHALVDYHAAHAQPGATLTYLDRLLALEPAHEEAHRHKMLLLALRGQRSAALHQYEACCRAMHALDMEPDGETTALCERIRRGGQLPVPGGARVSAPGIVTRHNLPMPLTALVGRERELSEIRARLRDADCRLLNLVGPGGVGKTHLALETAGGMLPGGTPDCFEDGVFIVRADSLPGVEAIVPAIAQALDLPLAEGAHPQEQVEDSLREKKLLLVMDGYEHLAPGAGLLVDLLHAAPGVKFLVTSRARLAVQAEHQFPVEGLRWGVGGQRRRPERLPAELESFASMPAVQLYLSSARRVRPGFEPSAGDLLEIVRICRLVDGLPLAILLAASWTGMLTPAQIASELEGRSGRGLGLLQSDSQDLPARHRSMRAVFDHSWNMLAARERQVLAKLSVFRGSFTLEAARQVAGASLGELRALTGGSLLQPAAAGRYALHDMLRQYGRERLAEVPEAAKTAGDGHSAYYAEAVEKWWADLQGPRHQSALAEMGAENGNLSAAWDWAVERGHAAQLDRAMEGLCYFYKWLGRYEEGERLCRRAVEGLAGMGAGEQAWVQARALAWQGVFCHRLGRGEQARNLLSLAQQCLDDEAWRKGHEADRIAEEIERGRAFIAWRLGNLTCEADGAAAERLYRESLGRYRALNDSWGTASVLEAMGRSATFAHRSGRAHRAYEESLTLREAQGDDLGSYRVLSLDLATTAYDSQTEQEPGESSVKIVSALHGVSVAMGAGEFAKSQALLDQQMVAGEGGWSGGRADVVELVRALNQMHLGEYERARARTMDCLTRYRETGYNWGMERCCCYLGLVALAVGEYDEGQRWLDESAGLCRETRQRGHLGQAFALMALVARASGRMPEARGHLGEALRVAALVRDYETFMFQMIVVSAMALILADEGQVEHAVEVYAMASRYPLVAHSRLMEDLAGRHMSALEAHLPGDVASAARARGRARDVEAALAEMLAELEGQKPG